MLRESEVATEVKATETARNRIANPKLIRCFDMMREMLFEQIQQDAALIKARTK